MENLFNFIKESALTIEGVEQFEFIKDGSELDNFTDRKYTFGALRFEDYEIDENNNTVQPVEIMLEQYIDAEEKTLLKQADILKRQFRELKYILSRSQKYQFDKRVNVAVDTFKSVNKTVVIIAKFNVLILEGNFCPI